MVIQRAGRLRAGTVATALACVVAAGCTGGEAPTPAPPPASTAAASPSAAPPATPDPAATTSGAAAPSVAAPVPDRIPTGFRLPNEGERSTSAEFTDWTTDNTVGQAWLLDPCQPTSYPTDRQRVSFRTVSQTGPEAHSARQLGVYPSAAVAGEVLAGFRRALAACATGTTPTGLRWQWVFRDVPTLGQDGLLAASVFGADQAPTGDRIAVTRFGDAIFLAYEGGEWGTAELDQGTADAQAVVQRFLDSL